ncbi:MAG: hypothetical protein K2L47_02320, partial [Clostridia bacterium]|nr:hypothetical protein [Clostridia bacterium]
TIIDNTYDAQVFKDIYNVCQEDKNSINRRTSLISVGAIRGGSNTGNGGGIYAAANSTLNIYSGMIDGNFAKNGGAIFVDTGSKFNMYGGIIFNNETTGYAPGVYVTNNSTFKMYDGIIISNTGQNFGGGIHVSGLADKLSYFVMHNGIIAHNYSMYGAGVSLCEYSESIIYNAEICYNYALGNSAGLLAWNYTSKVDLYNCKINNNIAYFSSGVNGGAGILSNGELNIHGGEICDNTYINSYDTRVVNGGGVYISAGSALFESVVVARNQIKSFINDGEHAFAGGISIASAASENVVFGADVQVYDNIAHGINSDIRLEKGQKINITAVGRNTYLGIKLADDYGSESFTNGYGANNGDDNPSEFFFSNDGVKIAILNGGEVSFENTIESNTYDFVYFENDVRKNYADNNLIHAVNDYEKSKTLNGGKLILGNILPNTSVNEFITKVNYSG